MLEMYLLKTTVKVARQEHPIVYYAYGKFSRDWLSSM
jgi:hypothetical protein